MKRAFTSFLAALLLLGMLGSSPVAAHERIEQTRISIRASRTHIDEGDRVRFRGRLKSDWKRCFRRQTVTLFKGDTPVVSKKTTRTGRYRFTRSPKNTRLWHVEYAGRRFGPHPHVHRCLASSSRSIRVTVR